MNIRTLIATSALTLALALPAAAETLKYAFTDPADPISNPTAAHGYVFADTLARLTGGKMTVDLFPNGQLGDHKSVIQQVRRGTINIAPVPVGVLASLAYPKLGVFDLPFLYSSRSDMLKRLSLSNAPIKAMTDDVAKQTGIRIVGFLPLGFRAMTTSKTAVHSPADLAGLKMRTMEVVPHQEMMKALGASPVPIPYLELYTSLQTGVVDGEENTPTNILQQKFNQVQGHMTLTNHLMTVVALIVNDEWYQGLDEKTRALFDESAAEASLAYAGVGAVRDSQAISELRKEGMDVYAPTPDEMVGFHDAVSGPVRAWAEEQYGKDLVASIYGN